MYLFIEEGIDLKIRFRCRDGKERTFLTPDTKGKKFAVEIKQGIHYTNEAQPKVDRNGEVKPLTANERAYRAGYLDARRDSANAYNAKHGRPVKYRNRRRRSGGSSAELYQGPMMLLPPARQSTRARRKSRKK